MRNIFTIAAVSVLSVTSAVAETAPINPMDSWLEAQRLAHSGEKTGQKCRAMATA